MKIIQRILWIGITLLLFVACKDEERTPQAALQINGGSTFLSLDASPRSGKLTVKSVEAWSLVAPVPGWFTLSRESGPSGKSEINVSLTANAGEARSAVLRFVAGDKEVPFTLSQSAANVGFNEAEYAFYVTFGTMPTLYAGLYMLTHDTPSWVFYERTKTFKPAEFPAYASVAIPADPTKNASNADMVRMAAAFKRQILKINSEDPTAVFALYVDDLRCQLGYRWFVEQGIDPSRVKVTLLSDGTATYNNYKTYFGNPATAEQNWNSYAAEVDALDWNHGGRYPETRIPAGFNSYTWAFYMATRPDYRLVLQNRSLIEGSPAFDATHLPQIHFEEVHPYELLSSLSAEQRSRFLRMADFDATTFSAQFDASPKPNLVIIGTNPDGDGGKAQQRAYVAQVVERYGDRYDLFFKPHPVDTSSADYPTRFPGMTLLPGQMPFEIFVWVLLDKIDLIGGYASTSFIATPLQKVGFLFAPNAASLVSPLDVLFRDAPDVVWID